MPSHFPIEPSSVPSAGAPLLGADLEPLSVLLVEDDPIDAAILARCLEKVSGNFKLHVSSSLADAVQRLQEHSFQLIITDLGLPDSEGSETVRRIGRAAGGVPMLVVSDGEEQIVGLPSLRGGAQDFLPKSMLRPSSLQRAIKYGLERRRMELRLETMAMRDGLTGAHNRAFF